MFDPFQLELGVTPDTVKKTLNEREYAKGIFKHLYIGINNNKINETCKYLCYYIYVNNMFNTQLFLFF